MRKRLIIAASAALVLLVFIVLWGHRFASYQGKGKGTVLPNGEPVGAVLTDVRRVDDGRIRIKMDVFWYNTKSGNVFVPDVVVTRPSAIQVPRSPETDGLGQGEIAMSSNTEVSTSDTPETMNTTSYFELRGRSRTIDIAQSFYHISSRDVMHVELPLAVHSVRKWDTGSVEILSLGYGKRFNEGYWRGIDGDVRLPTDAFCVRVKQTDRNGSLMPWVISAAGGTGGYRSDGKHGYDWDTSCVAELVDNRGHSVRMVGNFVAYKDCSHRECTTDLNTPRVKFGRKLVQAISLGQVQITGGPGVMEMVDVPGNGEWLYVFRVKNPSKYSKIRIQYLRPPKPKDMVTIRFNRVPI